MKIKHNTISLTVLLLLVLALAIYQVRYIKTIKQEVKHTEVKPVPIPNAKITFDNNADTSKNTYQNGTFPGIVTAVNYGKDGSSMVDVDFVQIFGGKEAFLALVEDYELGKNKSGNWDAFKSIYPTFKQLKSAVMSMSDEQFDTFYYNISSVETQKNGGVVPGGILGSFPNGFVYERNESNKIRTFKIAKDVKTMSITNSDATVSISEILEIKDVKNFTLVDGVITAVQVIYRP